MNDAMRARYYRLIPLALVGTLVLALISLPLWANEPGNDDGEKSSRKSQAQPPAAASTKAEIEKTKKPTDKPTDKGGEKSSNKSTDKTSEKPPVKPVDKTSDKSAANKSSAKGSTKPSATKSIGSAVADEQDSQESGRLEIEDAAGPQPDVNKLRDTSGKQHSSSDNELELTIEDQQHKDQGECPGSEASKVPTTQNVNDVPLEQEEHPFDAPSAETDDSPAGEEGAELAPIKRAEPDKTRSENVQTESQRKLEQRINTCLAYYYTHHESLAKRSPWAVMHTILPFGVETDIAAGHRNVNAIGWMCYNGVCKTQRMFQSTSTGFRTNVGPGVQGHEGQFLAVLAQSSVPRNFPIVVGKNRYTVSDLIRYEMVTCREKSELTFKLIGLSHYLAPNQTWRDERGHTWNLEKLVREELDQPVVGAACGGTHRLMGLSYALMMRRRYKQPETGHWARANVYTNDFVQYAWSLQNPDGSFSTDWFEGRANEPNMERKVQTTGHILEWLIFTLPADDLNDPRVAKSVEFILSQVYDHRDKDWPIGPRGHSLRAISLYNQRVFGAPTGQLRTHLAQAGYMKELR